MSCTVSGLTNGTPYTFTVTATNVRRHRAGLGPLGLGHAAGRAPGAPTGVTATAGNAQALVAWSAPASDGGSPITGYTATSSPGAKTCTTSGALSCTVSGLTNGTPYTFTVTATNAAGTGPASAPSGSVTPHRFQLIRLDNATYGDLAGYPNDRYGTDAAVAEQAFGSGASTVYIASGANFPDALGAGAAAAQAGGPVLLVTPTSIPAAIAHELTALHPTTIYVVGGTASVSMAVLTALETYGPTQSIASTTPPTVIWRAIPTTATAPTRRSPSRPSAPVPRRSISRPGRTSPTPWARGPRRPRPGARCCSSRRPRSPPPSPMS